MGAVDYAKIVEDRYNLNMNQVEICVDISENNLEPSLVAEAMAKATFEEAEILSLMELYEDMATAGFVKAAVKSHKGGA